jgi:ubiquinone/menaquinone biosynthesis C-methylase UbiE
MAPSSACQTLEVRFRAAVERIARLGIPTGAIAVFALSRSLWVRLGALGALLTVWSAVYARYRRGGIAQTAHEYELLRTASLEALSRHYNERVPTIEEEFDLWGAYHQHRHEMRYDLLGDATRRHLPTGGRVLDIGCGSALVADRITDLPVTYVGFDYGGHHVAYASQRLRKEEATLTSMIGQCDAEHLPFADATFDVVVMSEVIEHLMRPELATWEVARVLRPGGVFVMTTNNASEVPLRSPVSHLFAWLEKALGAHRPSLISLRPWIWPEPVDPTILSEDVGPVYMPHTHHIYAETRDLFGAAGLETISWSTFEFPPPQAALARWLDARGEVGQRIVDRIETVSRHMPLLRRMGCHLLMEARKVRPPVSASPPPGVWDGPFSDGAVPPPQPTS